MRKILVLCVVGMFFSMIGCSNRVDPSSYQPPQLDSSALTVSEVPLGSTREGDFPDDGHYLGYMFEAREGAGYDIILTRTSGQDVPAIVLYQFDNQGFSEAIAWASADADVIQINGWTAEQAGQYLVLVDVVDGDRTGTFSLEVSCVSGCDDDDHPDPGGPGALCQDDTQCADGLECLLMDEGHGYCAEHCDCQELNGCTPPAQCLWTDGSACWCGYLCESDADCPNNGEGWTCYDIGSEMGEQPFFTCLPVDMDDYTCTTDSDCAPGEVCMDGYCYYDDEPPYCRTDADCAPDEICIDGYCYYDEPYCQSDYDCAPDEICIDGYCYYDDQPPYCRSDDDCGPGMVCIDGYCSDDSDDDTDQPYCRSNEDCAQGQVCENGVCVADGPHDGQPGDLCQSQGQCSEGLDCLMMDDYSGYCAGRCDCESLDGCAAPSQCLWSDGSNCWCGYLCESDDDCPNNGQGWTCYDIGSEMGEQPFFTCLPIVLND